jgi:hypothetical protein
MADSKNLFSEVQGFTQWWLWTIIYGVLGSLFYATYQSFNATGSIFQTDTLSLVLMSILLPVLFYLLKLKTRITSDGIYVRFVPFHLKEIFIPFSDLSDCYVRQYSPIGEFGGWGIKYGLGGAGKVYNVSGNMGLQLVYKDGSKLLIGSQRSEEIQKVLTELGNFAHSKS